MKRIGVYAGSFDPITYGHLDIVRQALGVFDQVHVMIGVNPDKKGMFTLAKRMEQVGLALAAQYPGEGDKVHFGFFEGLLVDHCAEVGAAAIIRGLRDHVDFAYESHLAALNKELGGVHTVWFYPSQDYAHVSSSLVRELIRHGRDFSRYSPIGT